MEYVKTIVCLANSRKLTGRCIAGKEYEEETVGNWIRPVSARPAEEISEEERRYEDGQSPQVLDIVSIPFKNPAPHSCQTENHLIDDGYYWAKRGRVTWQELGGLVDDCETLWSNGGHSTNGFNDRITTTVADTLDSSLLFVRTENLSISVGAEGAAFGDYKRKVRAKFQYQNHHYKMRVTDPVIEAQYLAQSDGTYSVGEAYICVSLGEPYNGYRYKLAAGIITSARTR